MTADEARRATMKLFKPERMEQYHQIKEQIKRETEKPINGGWLVLVKGEINIAALMFLTLDGYKIWFDGSEQRTHIEWGIDTSGYKKYD